MVEKRSWDERKEWGILDTFKRQVSTKKEEEGMTGGYTTDMLSSIANMSL